MTVSVLERYLPVFDRAIANIVYYQSRDDGIGKFVNWYLENDYNPYNFITDQWAGSLSTAEGLSHFLLVLAHALYDDGDVCFPVINGRPRIAFVCQRDFSPEYALTKFELESSVTDKKVKMFLTSIEDFMDFFDRAEEARIMRAFKFDYSCCTTLLEKGNIIESYRKYKFFNESWIQSGDKDNADL